ncbi:MAG: DUF4097 family beta strand repeat-containing protein [Lachnospiraceae bacterium]|nr:DUF4097 family beta strand repeat-containing protein [Lachnospiraceae bacterium]
MFDFYDSKLIKREYECTGKIVLLNIVSSSDGIRIKGGDVQNVHISYWECPGKHEYDLNESEGKVSLIRRNIKSILWGIHYLFLDTTIEVTVPVSFEGNIELNCTSGKIELSDINAENLSSHTTSGAFRASDINLKNKAEIGNTSGSIKINTFSAKDISASTTSGSVNMNGVNAERGIKIHTGSGSIGISDSKVSNNIDLSDHSGIIKIERVVADGDLCAHNTSGGVHFNAIDIGGNIVLKSTSGSIKGSIVGNENDYSISSKTTSGINNLRDLNNSMSGRKMLDANTTSGSIKIVFENGIMNGI